MPIGGFRADQIKRPGRLHPDYSKKRNTKRMTYLVTTKAEYEIVDDLHGTTIRIKHDRKSTGDDTAITITKYGPDGQLGEPMSFSADEVTKLAEFFAEIDS